MTMQAGPLTLAAINWDNIWQGVALMVVGMAVVFIALIVVGSLITVVSWLLRHSAVDDSGPAVSPVESMEPMAQDATPTIAILAAAATVALGRRVRVTRFAPSGPGASNQWSQAGRSDIHTSHKLRRNL